MARKLPNPLLENDWQSLADGETIRVHCDHPLCEDKNDAFTITKVIGGCIYNCYRCGTSGAYIRGSNPREASERIRQMRRLRHSYTNTGADTYSVSLPSDSIPIITYDSKIPSQAHAWLWFYELNDEDFDNYYIVYSPRLERLIFPIYKNNKLIAWQGRDVFYKRNLQLFDKGYIKKKPLKYYTEAIAGNKLFYTIDSNINKLILVEDIVSAIKVFNKYKYKTIALLNSTMHDSLVPELNLTSYDEVFVWLDPDKAMYSLKGCLKWKAKGVNAKCIRTPKDPKEIQYKDMPNL